MVYDDAWDMPKANWVQQGSFVIPEIPPAYEPDEAPLVCLPAINQYWLPYVMGALDQLRNPSSWLVADDAAMYLTLNRVTKLREMLGIRAECGGMLIRFDGASCQLQQSTDGGTTWTEIEGWGDFVSCLPPQTRLEFTDGCVLQDSLDDGTTWVDVGGWAANFGPCVQAAAPIIGLPPNPGDQTPEQLACSIATYLAEQIIVGAMGLAVTAITDNLSLLTFGASVLSLIPEFVIVRLGYDAIATLYGYVAEGTLTDYEDALTDAPLLAAVTCAIYGCIVGDGYVKPNNIACILAAISAITYAHADVITAINGYLSSLGAEGLAQLSQVAGLETGADCSGCSAWCVHFNFALSDGGWTAATGLAVYTPGFGWDSVGPRGAYEADAITIYFGPAGHLLSAVRVVATFGNSVGAGGRSAYNSEGTNLAFAGDGAGAFDETLPWAHLWNDLTLEMDSTYDGVHGGRITDVYITGEGTNPFLSRYGTGVTDC